MWQLQHLVPGNPPGAFTSHHLMEGFLSLAVELLDLGSSLKVKYRRLETNKKSQKAWLRPRNFSSRSYLFCFSRCEDFATATLFLSNVAATTLGQCLFSARPSNLQMRAANPGGSEIWFELGDDFAASRTSPGFQSWNPRRCCWLAQLGS